MNLSTPEANHLFVLLMIGAPIGYITERTVHLAMIKAGGAVEVSGFVGRDPVVFLMTLFASLGALLPSMLTYGLGDVVNFLSAARHGLGVFGWMLTALVVIHVLAPFVVAGCLLRSRQRRTNRESRIEPMFVALGLLGVWMAGGFVALMTVHWNAISLASKGHGLTVWLMIAFALVGSVYFLIMRMGRSWVAPRIVAMLVLVIETFLALSYSSW